jgi:NAD+ kinase
MHSILCEWHGDRGILDQWLTTYRYVQDKLKDLKSFDIPWILEEDGSKTSRLKYWDEELCKKMPHKFDIVLAVSTISRRFS